MKKCGKIYVDSHIRWRQKFTPARENVSWSGQKRFEGIFFQQKQPPFAVEREIWKNNAICSAC